MKTVTEEERLAADFETHRPYPHAIAFRVLGSHADADDAVQEAWLRLARAGGGSIADLRGWLTTVTGRICLDLLRRRGVRSEEPLELSVGILDAAASPPRAGWLRSCPRGSRDEPARHHPRGGCPARPGIKMSLPNGSCFHQPPSCEASRSRENSRSQAAVIGATFSGGLRETRTS
jgi:hypothetical protein